MAKKKKTNGSLKVTKGRNKSLLGYNSIFTPEVIDDIHIKAQLGRYRMRGMALMKKIPTFDDLVFFSLMPYHAFCIDLVVLLYVCRL